MMKKVGLTMRIDVASTGEVRDALDNAWPAFLNEIGFWPIYLPNSLTMLNEDILEDMDALLLTGGNDVLDNGKSYSQERNDFELRLLSQAQTKSLPVLGICRGAQIINVFLGGKVQEVTGHVACNHLVKHDDTQFEVNSFHDYGIHDGALAKNLSAAVHAEDGTVEGFFHMTMPWFGLMWHPERAIPNTATHKNIVQNALSGLNPWPNLSL